MILHSLLYIMFHLLRQRFGGQYFCVQGILQRPAPHGGKIDTHPNAYLLVRLVKKGDAAAKPVDDVVKQVFFARKVTIPLSPANI